MSASLSRKKTWTNSDGMKPSDVNYEFDNIVRSWNNQYYLGNVQVVYPEQFGALGNGVHNDAPAIQAAINSISPTKGGIVQLSSKPYKLASQITITGYCITIQGSSIGMGPYDYGGGIVAGTQLIGTNGVNGFVTSGNVAYLTIKDLQINLPSAATIACKAIDISNSFLPKVMNVRTSYYSTGIYSTGSTDIYISRCYLSGGSSVSSGTGINLAGNSSTYIENTICDAFYYNYWINSGIIADVHLINCEGNSPIVTSLLIDGSSGLSANLSADIFIHNCVFDTIPITGYGIIVFDCGGNTIINIDSCWVSEGLCGILISNSSGVNVNGCQIYGVIADYPTLALITGIELEAGSTNCNISNNHIYYPYSNGIYVTGSPNNIISKNIIVGETAAGANAIYFNSTGSTNCVISENIANGISGSFGTGINIPSGNNGCAVANNKMPATICTTPYTFGSVISNSRTRQILTSGTTYTTPLGAIAINVRMVGGGGGGGSGGTTVSNGGSGGTGGNTTWNSTLLVANGGSGGSPGGAGGVAPGGTASIGSGPVGVALQGGSGQYAGEAVEATDNYGAGGMGAASPFGGAGGGGTNAVGQAAITNTGSGGGGGGTGVSATAITQGGGGGGSGGFVDAIISNPAATYSYAIGAAGAGNTSPGATGNNGGNGGSGLIIVDEFYQ